MRVLAVLLTSGLMVGCSYLRATEEPIPTRWHIDPGSAVPRSDTLLVFLPGVKDDHHDIFDLGAIDALEASGLDWDVVTVDAHLGYYREQSFLDRLEEDVLAPARDRGYETFWLTGPSLGGFGSLFYWCRNRDPDIEGIIAMAPWMGNQPIITSVAQAGGINHWRQNDGVGEEHERQLWTCLQTLTGTPEIWLAYGSRDDLAPAHEMLAEILPDHRVLTNDGDHLWDDWIPLWQEIFARLAGHDSDTRP